MERLKETFIKTGIAQLGYSHLYQPGVYKGKDDDKKKEDDKKTTPKYEATMILDKVEDADTIARLKSAQDEIVAMLKKAKKWSKEKAVYLPLVDCDEAEATLEDGTIGTKADKNPRLKGKCMLRAKTRNRAPVYYLGDDEVTRELPTPIINPDESDEQEVERSEEIAQQWRDKVFAGQNAILSVTLYDFPTKLPSGQGVGAELNSVYIVGGGTPLGTLRFEEMFTDEDIADIAAWVRKNVRGATLKAAAKHADKEDVAVDDETGEIEEKPHKRRVRKPEPEPEPEEDVDEDDIDAF